MNEVKQTVKLFSENRYGQAVPPRALGEILRVIPEVVRFSIRMAFESRSKARGVPHWLASASDVRFLGLSGEAETCLHFHAPRLGDAAGILYEQKELWSSHPDPDDTGFDLLGDVIQDVASNATESSRFDRGLLQKIGRFGKGLNGEFQKMEFTRRPLRANSTVVIDSRIAEIANQLSRNTPEPRQTRIVGKLDMIRSSTNAFAIHLRDGTELRGVLIEGNIAQIRNLIEHDVLILGKTIYRPSGSILRMDADEVRPATEQDQFFTTAPPPRNSRFDLREVLRSQQHKKGISAIIGKWPGDETDEQIAAALKEIG